MSKKNFKVTTSVPEIPEDMTESELGLFDPLNPDIGLFNMVDEEQIRLSGSKINYFKFVVSKEYDDVYMEQRNKPILTTPVLVYGHYDPRPIEQQLGQFGIELTSDQIFTFNKSYITKKLGRAPQSGDVLQPAFQKVRYEVIEVQEDSFEVYGVYHYVCTAKVQRDSGDVQTTDLNNTSEPLGGL